MNILNNILLNFFSKTLKQNTKFKDLHKGESCYLFGNGSSLKYYELKQFNDKVSIGCNILFAHKDLKDINIRYYFVGHPFLFHRFWKNPYSKRYETNKLGKFYREKMALFSDIQYFTSLTNYFGIWGENVNYVYHFEQTNDSRINYQMDNVFSMMDGSLMGMIGVALYLGYTDITLVGCDYTFAPKMQGHFYERGPEKRKYSDAFLCEVLNLVKDKVNIRTITPHAEFRGHVLPSITYEAFTGDEPLFRENNHNVSKADLKELNSTNMQYKIY